MTGYNEFINRFGDVTFSEFFSLVFAGIFLYIVGKKLLSFLEKKIKADHEKNQKLEKVFDVVEKLPDLEASINDIKKEQEVLGNRLRNMEEVSDRRARNRLRETLLQNYRYYTSKDRNPMQAWTRMESDAFWDIFGDYTQAGGNGTMHNVVQPAMNELRVIELSETDAVAELMHSRK